MSGSWTAFASGRWIRQNYAYTEEFRSGFSGSVGPGGTLVVTSEHRYVERMTAHLKCAGVDSATVRAAISSTLPTIYIPGGGTDAGTGATGWTTQQPRIDDLEGGNSEVSCTWEKATAWSAV